MYKKKLNKVEKLFVEKSIVRPSGWFILSKSDALDFINACEKENIKILGIDGFFHGKDVFHPSMPELLVTPDSIQPSAENSVDFSSTYYIQKTHSIYNDAIEFLKDRDERLFFEIVCEDKSKTHNWPFSELVDRLIRLIKNIRIKLGKKSK